MRGSWFFISWLVVAVVARAFATSAVTVLSSLAMIAFTSALALLTGAGRPARTSGTSKAARPPSEPDGPSARYGLGAV